MIAGFAIGYLALAGYGLVGSVLAAAVFAVLRGYSRRGR